MAAACSELASMYDDKVLVLLLLLLLLAQRWQTHLTSVNHVQSSAS